MCPEPMPATFFQPMSRGVVETTEQQRLQTHRVPGGMEMGPESSVSLYSCPFLTTPSTPWWTSKYSVCCKWICLPVQVSSSASLGRLRDSLKCRTATRNGLQWRARAPLPDDLVVQVMRLYDDPAAVILLLELEERGIVCGEHGGLAGGVCALQGAWR
jgi:hypothetical protein